MNYYKRHIGDYARKAMHLSVLEHGVLMLLTDRYYENEQPFNMEQARRFTRAATEPGVDVALQNVLAEFFTHGDDGLFRSTDIEADLVHAAERAAASRENGQSGGRPRKNPVAQKKQPAKKAQEPDGLQVKTGNNLNPLIHKSTNPQSQEAPPTPADGGAGDAVVGDAGTAVEVAAADTAPPDKVRYGEKFLRWWNAYPAAHRMAKPKCWAKWKTDKLDDFVDVLVQDVTDRLLTDYKWIKEGGQFIPSTQTYLNQQRWNDGYADPPPSSGKRGTTEDANAQGGEEWANSVGGNHEQ